MKLKTYHILALKILTYRFLLSTCILNFLRLFQILRKLTRCAHGMYLLENNQVWQFLKFMVLSMLCTHIGDLWRPELKNTGYILLRKIKIILKEELFLSIYSPKSAVWNSYLCVAHSVRKSNYFKWVENVVWFSTKVRFCRFAVSFRQN